MNSNERIERALAGREVDRPPFSFWYHFRLHQLPGERNAEATLAFHRRFCTDLVKVMSDFPYPKGPSGLRDLKPESDPFHEQIRALEMIRDGLGGSAPFVETIFNPWNQARKMTSIAEVLRLGKEEPQVLLDALEAIAKSEANHARRALATGASGIFLAIDNHPHLTEDEYARLSEPFDRMVLEAAREAPLNIIHLHGERIYIGRFYKGWPAAALNHSLHSTGIPLAEVRRNFDGVIVGGLDEVHFRNLTEGQLREQWHAAQSAAGARFFLAPGCSVPDDTADDEAMRLVRVVGA